ncbi:MAG TPA: LysR family transcriptional regulator [Stellaceae bacterium]|nr:LysR family transcriptional regulator [Stellaceae bacterium]
MKQNFTVRQGALDGVAAFLSVAQQHRSFRRAAAELGVTPSAISQAVRALEARLPNRSPSAFTSSPTSSEGRRSSRC